MTCCAPGSSPTSNSSPPTPTNCGPSLRSRAQGSPPPQRHSTIAVTRGPDPRRIARTLPGHRRLPSRLQSHHHGHGNPSGDRRRTGPAQRPQDSTSTITARKPSRCLNSRRALSKAEGRLGSRGCWQDRSPLGPARPRASPAAARPRPQNRSRRTTIDERSHRLTGQGGPVPRHGDGIRTTQEACWREP